MTTKDRILEKLNEAVKPAVKPQDLRAGQTYSYEYKAGKSAIKGSKKFVGFAVVDDSDGSQVDASEFKNKIFKDWRSLTSALGASNPAQMVAKAVNIAGTTDLGIMAIFDGVYRDGKPGPMGGITGNKATWHMGGKPIKYFQ